MEALLAEFSTPSFPDLPPLHGGIMGFLGYDVIREVERLPDVPPDDHGLPDAVMSVIGSLAAFDHWRQRVYLIESVVTHDVTSIASMVRRIACINRRLFYHGDPELSLELMEEVYGCPVELVTHGVPHRVLHRH